MRWSAAWLFLLCAGGCLWAGGCGSTGRAADEVGDGGVPTSDCHGALADFCAGACPGYDDSVADIRQLAAGGRCLIAESGSCGAGRYTSYSSGFFGFTSWFDGAGRLLATYQFSDAPVYCERTSFGVIYGAPPSCARNATTRYCPR